MRHIKIMFGLCMVAVVAVSAVAAANAAAEEPIPYLFKLITAGKESNIEGGTFTAKGGKAEFRTASVKVVCATSTASGEFEKGSKASHLGVITVVITGCETTILGVKLKCQSGSTEGQIELPKWIFHLGAGFDAEKNKWLPVILKLVPGGSFAVKCGSATVTVTATGVTAGLFKDAGTSEPLGLNEPRTAANLVFRGEGEPGKESIKLLYTKFFFPLEKTTVENLKVVSENSIVKAKEETILVAEDTLEKFTNSKGEVSEIELVES